nr:capsular polysaccharide biosynthesis protein [Caulobacter sp. 17J80-11]
MPGLAGFVPELQSFSRRFEPGRTEAAIGWGLKPSSVLARRTAAREGLPYIALEDGFLRSVGLGELGARPVSLIADDLGVYYDASRPSRLEQLILDAPSWADARVAGEAREAIGRIVAAGLSKTNSAPPLAPGAFAARTRRRVLVVDQTFGDASIRYGGAETATFGRMLDAAIRDEPDAEIVVRRHPAVSAGAKRGCLPRDLPAGVRVFDADCRPADLLAEVDAVYVVTSLLGFEALLRGLPVRCFGTPFYAGWGLTRDEAPAPRRGRPRTLEQVFAAAYMRYSRYLDPVTGEACDIHQAIDRLLLFRRRADENAGYTACLGFAPWKHRPVRELLASPRGRVEFFATAPAAARAAERNEGRVVYWAARETPAMREALDAGAAPAARMEDGFIRSRGLGSDFFGAASVSIDDLGIYYDASRPSRLETLLQTAEFDDRLRARAARLRAEVVARGVSKYNLAGGALDHPLWSSERRKVLVVGQVETDKSIAKGCEDVRTNADLLQRVRAAHPDAVVIYKEHPDVTAGNRPGRLSAEAAALADLAVENLDVARCLERVDVLATMTSLAGFEALMRGKVVETWGRPFYAGWGLTQDALAIPRRTRRLTLDELVAGALILYPIYVSSRTRLPCEPEDLVREIAAAPPASGGGRKLRMLRAVLGSLLSREAAPAW